MAPLAIPVMIMAVGVYIDASVAYAEFDGGCGAQWRENT
jgi:hypothetical protein